MINYGLTYSIDPPSPIEITETKVFLAADIESCFREDESGQPIQAYQYNLIEYDKNEYIAELANSSLEISNLADELQAAKILILGVE